MFDARSQSRGHIHKCNLYEENAPTYLFHMQIRIIVSEPDVIQEWRSSASLQTNFQMSLIAGNKAVKNFFWDSLARNNRVGLAIDFEFNSLDAEVCLIPSSLEGDWYERWQ